jgi:glutaconate CoA-transferase subunit B
MVLRAVHDGVSIGQVRDQTPIDFLVPDRVATMPPPAEDELAILRALDPARQFLG